MFFLLCYVTIRAIKDPMLAQYVVIHLKAFFFQWIFLLCLTKPTVTYLHVHSSVHITAFKNIKSLVMTDCCELVPYKS